MVLTSQKLGAFCLEIQIKTNFKNRGQILAPMQKRKVPGAVSRSLTLVQLIWICSRVNESPA